MITMKRKVNWENCKTDLQRLVAYWVKIEYPELYNNATTEDIRKIYGRWSKAASHILLKCKGNLELAKQILWRGRSYYRYKKFNYTIETINRNFEKILKFAQRTRYDIALYNQYIDLCKKNGTKIDEVRLKQFLEIVEKPNTFLENKIIEEKRKIKIDNDIKKLIDIKFNNFFGGKQ